LSYGITQLCACWLYGKIPQQARVTRLSRFCHLACAWCALLVPLLLLFFCSFFPVVEVLVEAVMLLQHKVALITGATRGIGFATAALFARHGAHVFLTGRDQAALDAACTSIAAQVPDAVMQTLLLDVTQPDSVRDAFQQVFKAARRLDVLVANAGVMDDALISMLTPGQIDRNFQTNAYGALYCAQYASRLMARNKSGSIINVTSIMGVQGNAGQAAYAGSKAALVGITKSLAKELGPQNIRVNALAPGLIDTDLVANLSAEQLAGRSAAIAMGRIGSPAEVANAALFLASDLSAYVTGQVLGVDGGMVV
jgi:3-oxoacyl-[acyl-carrier protein] reductase